MKLQKLGQEAWENHQAGFRKGQCSLNCVEPSQQIEEAISKVKVKLMADSSLGLLPEVGGFTHEAIEEKTKKVRGRESESGRNVSHGTRYFYKQLVGVS